MMSWHDTVLHWWDGRLGSAGTALDVLTAPAELLYRGITSARNTWYDTGRFERVRLTAPVISVGNLAIGGTGKTPVTAWLARLLRDGGARPAVLHGGYAADEPALHALLNPDVPVYAGRDRAVTGRAAIGAGADVLVLDDAFQHRRLERDLDIVLVAAETWGVRRHILPRGPWREPAEALLRADHVVVTRRTVDLEAARGVAAQIERLLSQAGAVQPGPSKLPRLSVVALRATRWQRGDLVFAMPRGTDGDRDRGAHPPSAGALLVCAIAQPTAFEENARAAGATLMNRVFYPDHHVYSAEDGAAILERAGNGVIVTTAKDWVKLKALLPGERVWVLHQDVDPEDCDVLLEDVRSVMR